MPSLLLVIGYANNYIVLKPRFQLNFIFQLYYCQLRATAELPPPGPLYICK